MKWWRKNSRDDDLDRELRTDLELEAEEQTEGGLYTAKEAHYAALRAFGNLSLIKEQTRETWYDIDRDYNKTSTMQYGDCSGIRSSRSSLCCQWHSGWV